MSKTSTYHTTVRWTGEHWGHLTMGNGPEMKFSAPPDAHGYAGVFTPEDAFGAAANTCVMLMFIWASERFKLKLLSYECRTEGTKLIELDRTEIFTRLRFCPLIRIAAGDEGQSPSRRADRRWVCGSPVPAPARAPSPEAVPAATNAVVENGETPGGGRMGAAVGGLVLGGGVAACSLPCNPGIFIVIGASVLMGKVLWGVALMAAFAAGFSLPLGAILFGVSLGKVALKMRKVDAAVRVVAGALLVCAGLFLLATF
jgi:organic hydroperoxide reductase OsmC/OhrA